MLNLSQLTVRLCEGRFSSLHDVTIGVEFGARILPVGPPASLALNINDPATSSASASAPASPATSLPRPPSRPEHQKRMKLSLWDTAGQETYKSITRSYFRGASGALLVFDISRRQTFDAVTGWLHDLRQIAEEGIVVVLVGNKADLAGASLVEDAHEGAQDRGEGGANSAAKWGGARAANKRAVTRHEAEEWCQRNGVMRYVETSAKSGEGVERAFLEVAERIYQNIEAGKYDLNDRRSGVKGPGAGGANRARGKDDNAVLLGMNKVGGMGVGKSGWGSCCSG